MLCQRRRVRITGGYLHDFRGSLGEDDLARQRAFVFVRESGSAVVGEATQTALVVAAPREDVARLGESHRVHTASADLGNGRD